MLSQSIGWRSGTPWRGVARCRSCAAYDRYDYLAEKGDAFEKLSTPIERIVNPGDDNVIPLRRWRGNVGLQNCRLIV